MKISDEGLELIKHFESFQSCPYLCPALVPTIGYGTTHYKDRAVTMDDVCISHSTASYLLRTQVDDIYAKAVNHYVRVPISQNEFDALVSFAYNEGVGSLKGSTLLKKLNQKATLKEVSEEFPRWNRANGKVLEGLVYRRAEEAKLFLA